MKKDKKYQTMYFGKFPQKTGGAYPQSIEWLVLEENEQEMLLLSRFCLDARKFCDIQTMKNWYDTTWEKSSLREWLNGEFFQQAFDEKEKKRILTTTIVTTQEFTGNDTKNKVFLLDKQAVLNYFPTEEERKAYPTPYAIGKGASIQMDDYGVVSWWILPSDELPDQSYYPQAVLSNGIFQYHGRNIYHGDWTVRPAIRIKKEWKEPELKIEIIKGNILDVECDAIVTPTDCMLSGSGGLDAVIHQKAGTSLRKACEKYIGKLHTSDAIVTEGFDLKAKYIVHAVVPKWNGGGHGEWKQLEDCCRNIVFKASEKSDIGILAVPLLGTGVNGYPMMASVLGYEGAAYSILKSLNRALYEQIWGRTIHTIKIVCSNEHKYSQMQEAAKKMFGLGLTVNDRIRGSLLGGAIGDAFGYPVEFERGYKAFSAEYPTADKVAVISDDTQMTLFTACGILFGDTRGALKTGGSGNGVIYPRYIAMAYHDWYKTQYPSYKDEQVNVSWIRHIPELNVRRAPGITCLNALEKNDFDWNTPVNNSKGCGGVMRIAPIPLFAAGKGGVTQKDNARFCAETAAITHGHPLGWMSAAALGNILYDLMQNFSLQWAVDDTISFLQEEYAEYEDTKLQVRLLEEAKHIAGMSGYSSTSNLMLEFDGNKTLGEGWVGEEALAIAVCCSLDGKGFAQNMQSAVGHNGDSDSTGSVAGQIMGAYWGEKAIPAKWLKNLELREVIEEIADDLTQAVFMRKAREYENDEWMDKYVFAHK